MQQFVDFMDSEHFYKTEKYVAERLIESRV